MTLVDNTRDFN